jgi:hypothetical protein
VNSISLECKSFDFYHWFRKGLIFFCLFLFSGWCIGSSHKVMQMCKRNHQHQGEAQGPVPAQFRELKFMNLDHAFLTVTIPPCREQTNLLGGLVKATDNCELTQLTAAQWCPELYSGTWKLEVGTALAQGQIDQAFRLYCVVY